MKLIVLGLVLALSLAATITESKNEDGDFSCKLAFAFDSTSMTQGTDTHFKVEWSENTGIWEDGDEYNACWVEAAYSGSNIDLAAEPATKCYRAEYDGEKWSTLTEIAAEDFKLTCTTGTPKATNLGVSTCTLFFDKNSDLGIADDRKFIWFDADGETSVTTTGLDELDDESGTEPIFSSNQIQKITFGDSTCGMASVFSAITGLVSFAALAFF